MARLDADSLFSNLPLNKSIDICIDSLCSENENTTKITKDLFRDFLNEVTKYLFFMFSNKFYNQIDDVAMGSSQGPALTKVFICSFENNWLKDLSHCIKLVFYLRYVDDICIIFLP